MVNVGWVLPVQHFFARSLYVLKSSRRDIMHHVSQLISHCGTAAVEPLHGKDSSVAQRNDGLLPPLP